MSAEDLLQTAMMLKEHLLNVFSETQLFLWVTAGEHTPSRDVPTRGGLVIIMCYRVLMPCIICTKFAWFFWASKQKVEWEVWNKT